MTEIRSVSSLEELAEVFELSRRSPVWLFKHSLVCGVSSQAWRQFRAFAGVSEPTDDALEEGPVFSLIEIQKARAVSQAVADRTGIRHESPQVILLQDGEPIWSASHWRITAQALEEATRSSAPSPAVEC